METFDLRIYPHKLMVRGNEDEFSACNYAETVYDIVKDMLNKKKIAYVDESTNESIVLLIKYPNKMITKAVVKKILCIFDCVHKTDRWIIK